MEVLKSSNPVLLLPAAIRSLFLRCDWGLFSLWGDHGAGEAGWECIVKTQCILFLLSFCCFPRINTSQLSANLWLISRVLRKKWFWQFLPIVSVFYRSETCLRFDSAISIEWLLSLYPFAMFPSLIISLLFGTIRHSSSSVLDFPQSWNQPFSKET